MKTNNTPPQVSVILPIFNGHPFLAETLNSITQQDLLNFEVIVIDDGSNDKSLECVTNWSACQSFSIQFVSKPSNFGVWSALRDATRLARGAYIAQIGQDDIWMHNHLRTLVDTLESSPYASAAFANISYIDAEGKDMAASIFKHENISAYTHELLFAHLIAGNFLCAPSSMFRRDYFHESYWGVSNERLQDYELWLNLLLIAPFVQTSHTTCKYRLHSNNLSCGSKMRLQSEYEFLMTLIRIFFSERFDAFYVGLTNLENRMEFTRLIDQSLRSTTEYCSTVALIHSAVLEKLSLLEAQQPQEILAMRARVARSLGLYRKSLNISKACQAHYHSGSEGLPYLVPAHSKMPTIVQSLFEEKCFRADPGIDFQNVNLPFFFACSEDSIEVLRKYESIEKAAQERRILLVESIAMDASHPYGFAIKKDQEIDHSLINQLFLFFEEAHNSFRNQSSPFNN